MAHFLLGMTAQLLLLIIFTHKSDELVFGLLLIIFLSISFQKYLPYDRYLVTGANNNVGLTSF